MKLSGGIFLVRVHIQDGQANLQQISSLHLLDSYNVFHFTCKALYNRFVQEPVLTCISCFAFLSVFISVSGTSLSLSAATV